MRYPSLFEADDHKVGDLELGEVKVSLGVISGRLVLHRSSWQRVRQAFRRRPLEEQVAIAGANAFVHVHAEDEGTIDVYMRIANFSPVPLYVEQLFVDWLGVSSANVSVTPPQLRPNAEPIRPRSIGTYTFRHLLLPGGVREIRRAVRRAANPHSSPDASLLIRGQLTVAHKSNRSKIAFQLEIPTPRLNFSPEVSEDA